MEWELGVDVFRDDRPTSGVWTSSEPFNGLVSFTDKTALETKIKLAEQNYIASNS